MHKIMLVSEWREFFNKNCIPYSMGSLSQKYIFILWMWLNLVMNNEICFCKISPWEYPEPERFVPFLCELIWLFCWQFPLSFQFKEEIVGDGETLRRPQEEHRGSQNMKQQNTVVQNSKTLRKKPYHNHKQQQSMFIRNKYNWILRTLKT